MRQSPRTALAALMVGGALLASPPGQALAAAVAPAAAPLPTPTPRPQTIVAPFGIPLFGQPVPSVTQRPLAIPAARVRLRDLGIRIGRLPTGPWNAITDVKGVKVGHVSLVAGEGKLIPGRGPVRTGVTAIVPRDDVWRNKVFASGFVLNGNGSMTALDWVKEAGCLETPILLTNTLSANRVADALVSWMMRQYPDIGVKDDVVLPCVAECDDSFLNDQRGRHVREPHVFAALDLARSGPVAEGAVGAGTGMVAYRFKAGIGTSSRVLPGHQGGWTVGVLVNANMGWREHLRIAGVPVGLRINDLLPQARPGEGSIIVIVATDAPLLPHQLERLAKRATLGLARTGSIAAHSSGDFVLAFSTAAHVPHTPTDPSMRISAVHNLHTSPLFEAVVEATEESIGNALTMATTMIGRDGHTVYALPLDRLKALLAAEGRLER
ncbi:MAG: P1 family peptidase [Candidatus Sericytochromatia bacterium]|nr:P1 family peptidase [Candidatus Sericytochromatia bacterium]